MVTIVNEHNALQLLIAGSYYSFDEPVIRLLLGRQLTTKFRKDMDEVSDASGMPLIR